MWTRRPLQRQMRATGSMALARYQGHGSWNRPGVQQYMRINTKRGGDIGGIRCAANSGGSRSLALYRDFQATIVFAAGVVASENESKDGIACKKPKLPHFGCRDPAAGATCPR